MMRPATTLRGSPSLAPVTAHPACPRCRDPLVQLEEPTCLPCGWADYSLPGFTCGICREPLPGDLRQRYCSGTCAALARNRRKAQAKRIRVRLGRCVRCGVYADATYCARHAVAVASVLKHRRERRRAAGLCRVCESPRVNRTHCQAHRITHNAMMAAVRLSRLAAGLCRQCGAAAVTASFCEQHRLQNNAQQAG